MDKVEQLKKLNEDAKKYLFAYHQTLGKINILEALIMEEKKDKDGKK